MHISSFFSNNPKHLPLSLTVISRVSDFIRRFFNHFLASFFCNPKKKKSYQDFNFFGFGLMDRLRPRNRPPVFSGFTKPEVEKMEKLFTESGGEVLDNEFCKKTARSFNHSSGRAGKPIVKWTEVQNWFIKRQQEGPPRVASSTNASKGGGERVPDLSELEFEARSSKDRAWYDVETFLTHRFLSSGEAEVRVRFVGFGADEDEWVNVKNAIRVRSVPFENSECHRVKVGDIVLCLQERRDQAIYYDARVIEIEKKIHDIRGCRCVFLIRYDHDNTEEKVRLRRLCYIPCKRNK